MTNWDSCYKLEQSLLQIRAVLTNWGKRYYKLGLLLQIEDITACSKSISKALYVLGPLYVSLVLDWSYLCPLGMFNLLLFIYLFYVYRLQNCKKNLYNANIFTFAYIFTQQQILYFFAGSTFSQERVWFDMTNSLQVKIIILLKEVGYLF